MLSRNLDVKCSWCGDISTLGEWNDDTYSKCTNREMKRAFVPLTEKRAFVRKTDSFYICPKCKRWSRGSQLRIVHTDDKSLLKLGGESALTTLSNGIK